MERYDPDTPPDPGGSNDPDSTPATDSSTPAPAVSAPTTGSQSDGQTTSNLRQALERVTGGNRPSTGGLPSGRNRLQGGDTQQRDVGAILSDFIARGSGDAGGFGPQGGTPPQVEFRDPQSGETISPKVIARIARENGVSPEEVVRRLSLEPVRVGEGSN